MVTEFINANPKVSLLMITIVVTFVSTLIHKWMTNQEHLKQLKIRQKEIQKELKGCKDENLLKELNLELMKLTGVMFKSSMRPMFVTIIPFFALFYWIRQMYIPLLGEGWGGWLTYYFAFSIASSMVFRKVFKMA
ncbi:DUF106 domain-containing protein [archaeon]|jgi:uncharacterized membrane protein (DUF106 family)|nr:DUF106 domain-containing protein [archaeon]MBT6182795.1 DUF106 domain-containing protein [archaeon]MBT6606115.1 DUF106 domain-containing protein [archaeon]MBT7252045.1 DUF106 domain-containing protein [archaeon]MBT7661006.1 DUF106 domain-containing protein [archaeon]